MCANDLPVLLPHLRTFLAHPVASSVNEPMLYKTAPIDFQDPLLELLPEAYLDSPPLTEEGIEADIGRLMRETAAFAVRHPSLWEADDE